MAVNGNAKWVIPVLVTAAIALLLIVLGVVGQTAGRAIDNEGDIKVLKEADARFKEDIQEIKTGQRRLERNMQREFNKIHEKLP